MIVYGNSTSLDCLLINFKEEFGNILKSRINSMQRKNIWENMWRKDDLYFHRLEVHPYILQYEKHFPPNSRIYVPLCGKSVDLVYLADKGFEVLGCEFVEKAVKQFFAEQGLEYNVEKDGATGIPVYTAVSKKITIYQGDFFKLNSNIIGKFNAMWDRGSLVAINPSDKAKYATIMLELMASNCKYLLLTCVITGEDYHGPPYSAPNEEIDDLFGKSCDIQVLESSQLDTRNAQSFFVSLLSLKH